MHGIFGAVEQGKQSVFDAIKAIASISIVKSDGGLSFAILAEARRHPLVADRLTALVDCLSGGVRRLAGLTRPDATAAELEASDKNSIAGSLGLCNRTNTVTTGNATQNSA